MTVVFDTNVLLSSTLWDGSVAQKLLFELIQSDIDICASLEILEEYQKVLRRDFDYADEDISRIMEKILSFVTLTKPKKKIDIVKADPDDNRILECAVESASKYIITYDKHLLNLGEHKGIKIIQPEKAMDIFQAAPH